MKWLYLKIPKCLIWFIFLENKNSNRNRRKAPKPNQPNTDLLKKANQTNQPTNQKTPQTQSLFILLASLGLGVFSGDNLSSYNTFSEIIPGIII